MWHFVYVLINESEDQYVGQTENVAKRLETHNSGSVTATKNGRPWKVGWFCAFRDKNDAINFEKYLKSGSGTEFRFRHLVKRQ